MDAAEKPACSQTDSVTGVIRRWMPSDPRVFQILFLGILLGAGVWLRDFSLRPAQIILTFASALCTQYVSWLLNPPKSRSFRSAIITSFSLSLLLRADNLTAHPLAAMAAIASKSTFRFRGKHLFNPATFGLVFAICALPGGWISPGQWGHDLAAGGWIVALGVLVTTRARRSDISWTFLLFYLGGIAVRVLWLGQLWPVWAHQLTNGALLLFTFFMISDPMTGPNARPGRITHAALVAAIALAWQFGFYLNNGLIWALFLAAPAVPLWDSVWPAAKFEWLPQGDRYEIATPIDARSGGVSAVHDHIPRAAA
ncbi:MAG TPA: RnfABCDGE type electron transport complex subunit D [Candidatus Binataceae bacterium]|nr:RnfABCDGE type electron transport complex subunit D [Candidatus Binataceae bacterium]